MTPAARVQAAIECLDQAVAAARTGGAAADTIVQRYFTTRRYAGSKDRRAVRDLVFDVIRSIGTVPESGRAALIGHARANAPEVLELFTGTADTAGHAPALLVEGEPEARPSLAPGWQLDMLRTRFGKGTDKVVAALLDRAPLDLRVNTLMANRDELLIELPDLAPTALSPTGLRAPTGLNIETLPAFHAGKIEVQDEGSQLAALAVGALPGENIIDLCAGAGGKTLALAAAMANEGRLVAADTDRGRLSAMPQRLARAGVTITDIRMLNPRKEWDALKDLAGLADRVLIDAPCSGTGTWRRNPEARWRLTAERLGKLEGEQDRLLSLAAQLVKIGGSLTYVVCSLLPGEGEGRINAFLLKHGGFRPQEFSIPGMAAPAPTLVLSPAEQGCDGFFIARLERVC
ncbi:rRNA cytosine-C5-methylase [Polymorphobacter glacialis]|uniref:rRNA cytosine-C5-methylase n=1 Tax=Sandarakinorhabdus glacialis TaxID=1614636 RepID=A0A917E5K6_9SPHN|nr:RsmB/NOP family class I SAM-dependent RNA methyltransferase [Polymorphobacter glacialis]GGE06694.1 rRNA cytosine-C5-methylase [Polymorphobacter glacialis]